MFFISCDKWVTAMRAGNNFSVVKSGKIRKQFLIYIVYKLYEHNVNLVIEHNLDLAN
jgi:hypothetical protein